MTAWAATPQPVELGVKVPEGMQIGGMGRRVGAWILDSIFLGLLAMIPFIVAIAIGAVGFNQQALDQIEATPYDRYDPFANITAPLITVSQGKLIAVLVLWIAIGAAYFIGSWLAWGGSPAQRILNLKVLDAQSGRPLSFFQAAIRWLLLYGAGAIIGGFVLFAMVDWFASTPMNEFARMYSYRYGTTATTPAFLSSPLYLLASYGPTLWSIALLVTTGMDKTKRGWHDKLAGSVVVGPLQPVSWQPGPSWPPQQQGAYPGWPPQPPGGQYPGWPPQGPAGQPPAPPQPQQPPSSEPPAPPAEPK